MYSKNKIKIQTFPNIICAIYFVKASHVHSLFSLTKQPSIRASERYTEREKGLYLSEFQGFLLSPPTPNFETLTFGSGTLLPFPSHNSSRSDLLFWLIQVFVFQSVSILKFKFGFGCHDSCLNFVRFVSNCLIWSVSDFFLRI